MLEIVKFRLKVIIGLLLLLFSGCSTKEDITIADFDTSRISGEYTARMIMDLAGPRPAVSVFGGSVVVDLVNADSFTLSIDFPEEFITAVFNGTLVEKIVSSSNSNIGGVYFEIESTSEYGGNLGQLFTVQTRAGETKFVYGYFIEVPGGEIEMNMNLIEKKQSPTTFEFEATK